MPEEKKEITLLRFTKLDPLMTANFEKAGKLIGLEIKPFIIHAAAILANELLNSSEKGNEVLKDENS